jgi:DNA-binding transcriptional LysR family regulator
LGIAILPTFIADDDLANGTLEQVLTAFRPPPMWIKAQVPAQKAAKHSVNALLDFLRDRLFVSYREDCDRTADLVQEDS